MLPTGLQYHLLYYEIFRSFFLLGHIPGYRNDSCALEVQLWKVCQVILSSPRLGWNLPFCWFKKY